MCCSGILFHSVVLQSGDSPRALSSRGIRVKRKPGRQFFLQPCPAHQDCRCAIYAERPARCREFACLQLVRVLDGSIAEADALTVIAEARRRAALVEELLECAGETRGHKPLAARCETVFTPPLDDSGEAAELRTRLRAAMDDLEDLLVRKFRTEPSAA